MNLSTKEDVRWVVGKCNRCHIKLYEEDVYYISNGNIICKRCHDSMDQINFNGMSDAINAAKHSTCLRLQVGAALVTDNKVVSTGYNHTPDGITPCNIKFNKGISTANRYLKHHQFSSKYEMHAEQDCIGKALQNKVEINNTTILYVTTEPCTDCAKLIVASGIKKVIFKDAYDRTSEGREFLKEAGIDISQLKEAE